jgi:hypothetical protein
MAVVINALSAQNRTPLPAYSFHRPAFLIFSRRIRSAGCGILDRPNRMLLSSNNTADAADWTGRLPRSTMRGSQRTGTA